MRGSKKGVRPIDRELWKAAATNMPTAVRLLLAEGADPNSRNTHSYTALMNACHGGHLECVKLLAPVSDCEMASNSKRKAWSFAHGQPELLVALVPCIDIHALDHFGFTPFDEMRTMRNVVEHRYSEFRPVFAAMEAKELGATSIAGPAPVAKARRL